MSEKLVTRVDLEKAGTDVIVREWYEGWHEGSSADKTTNEPRGYMVGMLGRLEKQGFTCEMMDGEHGRALRGKTTRVDIVKMPDGWHYRKYPYGWTAKTRPMTNEVKTEEEIGVIVAWCQKNGWNIRAWPGGYRAFKGQPIPVRDRASIMLMRRKVESDLALGRSTSENKSQYDFALDF